MKTRIIVNKHIIKANIARGENNPPLSVKTGKDTQRAHKVDIHGPCRLVYRPEKPLSCGATVWIEFDHPFFNVDFIGDVVIPKKKLGTVQQNIVNYLRRTGGAKIASTTKASELSGYDLAQVERALAGLIKRGIVKTNGYKLYKLEEV